VAEVTRPAYRYLLRKYTRRSHPLSGLAHVLDEFRARRGWL
jgi:hypothetical protein